MECLLPYLCMLTVPHIMVGLERMSEYRGVGLARFHFMTFEGFVRFKNVKSLKSVVVTSVIDSFASNKDLHA